MRRCSAVAQTAPETRGISTTSLNVGCSELTPKQLQQPATTSEIRINCPVLHKKICIKVSLRHNLQPTAVFLSIFVTEPPTSPYDWGIPCPLSYVSMLYKQYCRKMFLISIYVVTWAQHSVSNNASNRIELIIAEENAYIRRQYKQQQQPDVEFWLF